MKKVSIILILFLLIGILGFNFRRDSLAQEPRPSLEPAPILPGAETPKIEYAPGEVLVKFKTGVLPEKTEALFQEFGVSRISKIERLEIHHLRIPEGLTVLEMVERFKKNPLIEFAEPNYRRYKMAIPNDPYYSQQWALNQANDRDIDAQQGWNLETGSTSTIIAIIDDGIDYNHEEFPSGKLWINPTTTKPGYDFGGTCKVCTPSGSKQCIGPDDDVMHESGSAHGTATAGIAAAATNNAKGIAGTSWKPTIMPLKVEDSCGFIYDSYLAAAIRFAADNGAGVISMSLGGPTDSSTIRDACDYAWTTKGKVVLASSGNEGGAVSYPAAYPTTIAVGATTEYDWRAGWSNYGPQLDVVAPGTNIYTTDWSGSGGYDPGNYYANFGGTSASCPFAAGLAALLISHNPSLTNAQVRSWMRATAEDQIGNPSEDIAGFDNYYGYGRINVDAALHSLDNLADGTGKAEANPYSVKTTDLTLSLKAEVTTPITQWEVTVPSGWSWSQNSADIIDLTGGCSGATKNVVGNVITLTNCNIDKDGTYRAASFTIKSITSPSTGGAYIFSSRTAGAGGTLTAIDSDENAKVVAQKGTYDVFTVSAGGTGPDASAMAGYDIVVWETGDTYSDETLLAADRTAIGSYLGGGGKMFITGSGIAYDLEYGTDKNASWEQSYLGCDYLGDQTDFAAGLTGQAGTVGAGLAGIPYIDRGTGAYSTLVAGAATAVGSTVNFKNTRYVPSDQNIGFQKSNMVFLSFEYEGFGGRRDRADLMGNIINHLNSAATKILLVDDDRGFDNRETYYKQALEDTGYFPPSLISITPSASQPGSVATPSTDNVLGSASIVRNTGTGQVTAVTIKENGGTIDAQNDLENVELWLSSDDIWDAGDNQLDTAKNFNGPDGECTFTETFGVTTATQYLIVRLDVKTGVATGKTIEIQIKAISTTDNVSGIPCDIIGTTTVKYLVWGVLHSIHTTISDGAETPSQRVANLKSYYEWASTVDHDTAIDSTEWTATRNEANGNNTDNSFTYFAGYEWKGVSANNAEIMSFFLDNGPATKVNGNDANYDTFGEFASWLSTNNGMGCINHPARSSNVVDWTNSGVKNETYLPCVEMLNKTFYHWNDYWICAEGSGCTTYPNPSPDSSNWSGGVKTALDNGLHLGFVAGWDYHGSYPGTPTAYTGLVNPASWTRAGVFETIRKRHTWAAEEKTLMDVTYYDGLETKVMGDIFGVTSSQIRIDYDIQGVSGQKIAQVNLFYDGIIINVANFSSQGAAGFFDVTFSDTNEHYLFVEAVQDNGKRAWSSPMYITYSPVVAISLTTDGLVEFGIVALGATKDSSGDVQTAKVDTGPAHLHVRSTVFSDNGNSWSLGSNNGSNQVKWEFSPDGTTWNTNTFLAPDTLYDLASNVTQGSTQDLYLRITMPTETISSAQYSSTVTIVATAP